MVSVTLDRGGVEPLHVLATHLQHRNDATAMSVRLAEIDRVIAAWGRGKATVLAGDFNPKQGEPPQYPTRRPRSFAEIAALLNAGLTSRADLDACSAPTSGRNCSDYVFVSPDLTQTSYVVVDSSASDHGLTVTNIATA